MTRYWRVRVSLEVAEDDNLSAVGRRWSEIATVTAIQNGVVMWVNDKEPIGVSLTTWANNEFWKLGYEAAYKGQS